MEYKDHHHERVLYIQVYKNYKRIILIQKLSVNMFDSLSNITLIRKTCEVLFHACLPKGARGHFSLIF